MGANVARESYLSRPMHLNTADLVVIALSIIISFLPALFFWRRASSSTTEFFTSGRAAPWWLVGISMVATTFSTDTPNLVTNFVRDQGVAENWLWWSFLLTGMATVFFYAKMWRRSGVLTDLEFYEIRYAGRAATFVRGFRAVYLGLFFNCFIMATVNLAAAKIANILLGWPMYRTLMFASVITIFFASVSGLWGVLVTDSIQFSVTMTGAFAAAYFALQQPEVGHLSGLFSRVNPKALSFLPDFSNWSVALSVLIIPITIQWWSVWYPGAEPGGGSYIAQRMLASRSEKDAVGGTLLFNIMHYALRPWPWVIVALSSTLVFPQLADIARAFPNVDPKLIGNDIAYPAMLKFLPTPFIGLMLAGMLAAYRSTIETHLNWGTSYLVHDFYRRFLNRGATEKHYVLMGRIVTAGLMITAALTTYALDTAAGAFTLILSVGAGTGLIYLLRWFWWRVNAWSEVAAMASSFIVAVGFQIADKTGHPVAAHWSLIATVVSTTIVWVTVAYMTAPTDRSTLLAFYKLVRPAGPGWASIRAEAGVAASPDSLPLAMLGWVCGCAFIYSALFGVGSFLYGRTSLAILWTGVFLVTGVTLLRLMPRLWKS
jgi:solute:Na+ symporter, SSS family